MVFENFSKCSYTQRHIHGLNIQLKYPTVDMVAKRIQDTGTECRCFKKDLARAFHQMPVDPEDYSLLCFVGQDALYFVKVLTMGQYSAPYICQWVTSSIKYIVNQIGFFLENYIDNFINAERESRVQAAYSFVGKLSIQLAGCPPSYFFLLFAEIPTFSYFLLKFLLFPTF